MAGWHHRLDGHEFEQAPGSSRFVWEILTHQEMAPRWISTKNIHAKDKPAQLCAATVAAIA